MSRLLSFFSVAENLKQEIGNSRLRNWQVSLLLFAVFLFVALPAWAGMEQWTSNGPIGGRFSIAISPNYAIDRTLFAGSDGGTYGIYKSIDGGGSWVTVNNGLTSPDIRSIAISPNYATDNTVFVGSDGFGLAKGVDKSTNGGGSWSQALQGAIILSIAISPNYATDNTVFAGADSTILKSTNGGQSWLGIALSTSYIYAIAISPNYAIDHTVFAGNLVGGVYKSTDGGLSWVQLTPAPPALGMQALAISPNYAIDNTIFAGTYQGEVYKSTNAGLSWSRIFTNIRGIYALAISPNYATDNTVFAGAGGGAAAGGVYKSTNGGLSWSLVNNGLTSTDITSLAISPNYTIDHTIYSGIRYNGIYSYTFTSPIVANAGPDQTVDENTLVTLDGSASTGQNLTYSWSQVSPAAPLVQFNDPMSSTPSFTAPQLPGGFGSQVFTFMLTVSSGGFSSSESVDITVKNLNHAPKAAAGEDREVNEGSLVILDATNSYDPDGDPITGFQWIQIDGTPTVVLEGANTALASFTAPLLSGGVSGSATLVFRLTVSDGTLLGIDDVVVTVAQVNHPPTANAGSPQTVRPGQLVTLDGRGSSDPDNDPLKYEWTQVGGPTVVLQDPQAAISSFTAPPVAETLDLVFQLKVSDTLEMATAMVNITVKNGPPLCSLARAIPEILWPPNHKMVPVNIEGVTDPDDSSITIQIVGVTQDEPVNGLGDGDTSPDAIIEGNTVLLRAERAGNGNGRVYALGFIADDGQGGTCTGVVKVAVPHSKKPGEAAIDDGQLYNSVQP